MQNGPRRVDSRKRRPVGPGRGGGAEPREERRRPRGQQDNAPAGDRRPQRAARPAELRPAAPETPRVQRSRHRLTLRLPNAQLHEAGALRLSQLQLSTHLLPA